jgi:hypothetical protein
MFGPVNTFSDRWQKRFDRPVVPRDLIRRTFFGPRCAVWSASQLQSEEALRNTDLSAGSRSMQAGALLWVDSWIAASQDSAVVTL